MTASLYQSASWATAMISAVLCNVTASPPNQGQTPFFFFRSSSAHHFEHVRRELVGIQLDVVARPGPRVAAAGKEVVHFEGLVRREVEPREVELDESGLRVQEVEIHRGEDDVGALALRIGHELRIVDRVKVQAPVALQRRVLAPDAVEAPDQLAQAV